MITLLNQLFSDSLSRINLHSPGANMVMLQWIQYFALTLDNEEAKAELYPY